MINSSNSSKRVETGYINPTTTCEYKTSIDSSYVFNSSNESTNGSSEMFNLRLSFRFIFYSIVGLYSYDINTREFILINEARHLNLGISTTFSVNTAIYVNFYFRSCIGSSGFDIEVIRPENTLVNETSQDNNPEVDSATDPTVSSVIDQIVNTTRSSGNSKILMNGIIMGISIGVTVFLCLVIVLISFRNRFYYFFANLDKNQINTTSKVITKILEKIFLHLAYLIQNQVLQRKQNLNERSSKA